jgi:hypothetical protein
VCAEQGRRVLLDEAAQPLDRGPLELRILRRRVQAQKIKRLGKREVADFSCCHLCDHDVAALDCPFEDRSRMHPRRQQPSRWGRSAGLALAPVGDQMYSSATSTSRISHKQRPVCAVRLAPSPHSWTQSRIRRGRRRPAGSNWVSWRYRLMRSAWICFVRPATCSVSSLSCCVRSVFAWSSSRILSVSAFAARSSRL